MGVGWNGDGTVPGTGRDGRRGGRLGHPTSTVKIITVAPGCGLSSQYHHKRDGLWVVLDAGARVEIGGEVVDPDVGDDLFIPRGTVYRLSAKGAEPLRILEVSFGEFEEGDIVRLDAYGRVAQ